MRRLLFAVALLTPACAIRPRVELGPGAYSVDFADGSGMTSEAWVCTRTSPTSFRCADAEKVFETVETMKRAAVRAKSVEL